MRDSSGILLVWTASLISLKLEAALLSAPPHAVLDRLRLNRGDGMKILRVAVLVVGVAAMFSFAPSAQASGPYAGCGGIPFYYPFYAQYGREHIPYFALHPPVYYSYPVPRTYGYSPFAYPFGSPTPEIHITPIEPVKPKMSLNPYVPNASDRTTDAGPKMVYNPYVSTTRLASGAGR
jgi:hypothetical protein